MKKLTTLIVGILLATLVVAGVTISNLDKEIELQKPQRDALTSIGITDYKITDTLISDDLIERSGVYAIIEFTSIQYAKSPTITSTALSKT